MINNKTKTVLVMTIIMVTIVAVASICVLKADINKLETEKTACVDELKRTTDKLNRTTDKLSKVYEHNSDTEEAFDELISGETVTHDVVIRTSDGEIYVVDKDTINKRIKSHYKRK